MARTVLPPSCSDARRSPRVDRASRPPGRRPCFQVRLPAGFAAGSRLDVRTAEADGPPPAPDAASRMLALVAILVLARWRRSMVAILKLSGH